MRNYWGGSVKSKLGKYEKYNQINWPLSQSYSGVLTSPAQELCINDQAHPFGRIQIDKALNYSPV